MGMHAFLIIHGTPESQMEAIWHKLDGEPHSFHHVILETEEASTSITIAQVRAFQRELLLKPFASQKTVAIVKNADLLTTEAQNALLKILEEPPPSVTLFLTTNFPDSLLPTIASRCLSLVLPRGAASEDYKEMLITCEKIFQAKPGKKLLMVDAIAPTRDQAKIWIDQAIRAMHQVLENDIPTAYSKLQLTKFIRGLLTARTQLFANVTPKLVLDNLFLSLGD